MPYHSPAVPEQLARRRRKRAPQVANPLPAKRDRTRSRAISVLLPGRKTNCRARYTPEDEFPFVLRPGSDPDRVYQYKRNRYTFIVGLFEQ